MISLAGNSFLILTVLVFVAVLLLLEGLYMMWRTYKGPEATKLQTRLKSLSATHDSSSQTQLLKDRMLSALPGMERVLQQVPRIHLLDRFILQSGLDWTVSKFLTYSAVLAGIMWLAVLFLVPQVTFLGVLAGLAGAAAPLLYVHYRRQKRMGKLEQQLPEALDLIGRALRAGHAFSAALKMAGEEMNQPIASEFSTVHDEVNFGVSMQQALTNMSDRVPLTDVRYFVVAVLIQRDSGGNLTEILANLSRLIRDRHKLLSKVRVLSSEGRLSAWILGLMPFFLAGIMNLVNPDFMSLLWKDPMGIAIIKTMLTLMLVGALIMRKIIKIRV